MSPTIEEQIEGLKRAIAETEAQRVMLGDEFVDSALKPYQRKLNELTALLAARDEPPPAEPTQQRKLVTLLFMDIAGSTSITQHMDPEDVGEIFDVTLKKLARPIEMHGGHVTRFMGDGFLAVFGAPMAHEDDPEQAVRAGLKIIELSGEIAEELEKEWDIQGFHVRVGVNTGLVRLGGETEAEDTLMGAAVNLAARLESAASPGGLLVSHNTYRHIRGVFDVEPWEPIQVKGFDEAVKVYRVNRARPRAFRIHTRGVEGVETQMIGRHAELHYLQDALLTAIEENDGHLVTITGEAGVGKSRLLYEFQNWIDLLPPRVRFFEGRGRQEAQGLPYGLLRDLFATRFQIQDEDSGEIAREKIESGLGEVLDVYQDGEMRAHILGQLLGFDFSASPHLKSVINDPEQLRNRGLMYLEEYFRGLCSQGPIAIFLEDIHWADDSTLDALNWLGERTFRQRMLIVFTTRLTLFERRPYWGEGQAHHTRLDLRPLSKRESRQLVGEILRLADQVPPELFELVVEGAEGNPFYVEELVKMLVEDGVIIKGEEIWQVHSERLAEIEVPPTLTGVLQARLDSLPLEERAVLQQASVVGRLFWDRVVAHIQAAEGGRPQAVPEALTSLRGREMVYRREASAFMDAREYLFKHDILREVTYESVLKRLRRRYHGLVADWLITQVADRAGEYSGLTAGHLLLAGRKDQAGGYFLQAGQASLASYANSEAERYFRQALELSTSDFQRAACLAGLGEALRLQGRREESIQVFRQGIDLYLKLEDSNAVADLYMRLSVITWRINRLRAWEVCQEGLRRLEGAPEGPGMALLLAEAGRTAHFQGKPADEVISLCRRAIEMAERLGELDAMAIARNTLALATPDLEESIKLLQEAAEFSEANGLWYQAGRAYHNLAVTYFTNYMDNAVESANQLYLRALEFIIKIGDIEGLLFELGDLGENLIFQGHLKSVEDELTEILRGYTVPQSHADEYLDRVRSSLHGWRGEWLHALESTRHHLEKFRGTESNLEIANDNISLAWQCLELNRFTDMADLSEAEASLRENIEIGWQTIQSRLWIVVIFSRQERFAEAREQLDEVVSDIDQPISRQNDVFRLEAEAELARAEERWEEAVSTCQALIGIFQNCGYRNLWARWLIDLGDALIGRDGPGDRERAQEVYRQSLELFTEMGAPGYIRVLEERLGVM